MPPYCKRRIDIFAVSVFVGGAVSAVAFLYRADQISKYFDLPPLHTFFFGFLTLAYGVPTLILYLGFYTLNMLSIRFFGGPEFDGSRKRIIKGLFEVIVHGRAIDADPEDLVEEAAWISLREYWRPE